MTDAAYIASLRAKNPRLFAATKIQLAPAELERLIRAARHDLRREWNEELPDVPEPLKNIFRR